ncbi:DUF1318 domain-containing protein [bacterium]|nr:DUF1318 domain-containing protein [bacterium]
MNLKKWLALISVPLMVSCATVTVNVYFPDKDVEAVFEDIESGLDFDVVPAPKDTESVKSKSKPKRRSGAWRSPLGAAAAWADEGKAGIKKELQKMKDVQESLARRKERMETLSRLLDAAWVGLGKDGLIRRIPPDLGPAGEAESLADIFGEAGAETAVVKLTADENTDRKILIRGMAVATLRATEQDETDKESLDNALTRSAALFSKSRMGKLKPGWFYEDEDGTWKRVPPEEEEPAKER